VAGCQRHEIRDDRADSVDRAYSADSVDRAYSADSIDSVELSVKVPLAQ
jgi:acyl carrier protein